MRRLLFALLLAGCNAPAFVENDAGAGMVDAYAVDAGASDATPDAMPVCSNTDAAPVNSCVQCYAIDVDGCERCFHWMDDAGLQSSPGGCCERPCCQWPCE